MGWYAKHIGVLSLLCRCTKPVETNTNSSNHMKPMADKFELRQSTDTKCRNKAQLMLVECGSVVA
jgi:hypothetical protein